MVARGELLEWATFDGRKYGTPKAPVAQQAAAGVATLLEIDIEGARQVRRSVPGALLVFLAHAVASLTVQDDALQRAVCIAMGVTAWAVILPLSPKIVGHGESGVHGRRVTCNRCWRRKASGPPWSTATQSAAGRCARLAPV